MSRMSQTMLARRVRRQFSDEFKAGAIRLVLEEGKTVGAVARELDLTPSALAEWVRRVQADRTQEQTGLAGVEREELARLHKGFCQRPLAVAFSQGLLQLGVTSSERQRQRVTRHARRCRIGYASRRKLFGKTARIAENSGALNRSSFIASLE